MKKRYIRSYEITLRRVLFNIFITGSLWGASRVVMKILNQGLEDVCKYEDWSGFALYTR